jgi:hypothetical protein
VGQVSNTDGVLTTSMIAAAATIARDIADKVPEG